MMMQESENFDDLILFQDFCVKSGCDNSIKSINLELKSNCDVLLYSRNKEISRITGIFTFNVFNNVQFSGKLIHRNIDIINLFNKIKKFRINGNRIGLLAQIVDDVFPIPADPLELFDPQLTISEQLLDFIPYKTRIEILNGIIRREMIKLTEINEIIKGFDSADNKKDYTFKRSMDFGIVQIYRDIYTILNSKSENRSDMLAAAIISEKKGVNLADIVVLRNFYEYRMNYNDLQGQIYRSKIEGNNYSKIYKEIRALKKDAGKNFDFTNFKMTRSYSEGILKNEVLVIAKNFLELIGIPFDMDNYNKFPGDSISDIYKVLACLAFLTNKKIIIVDLSRYRSMARDITEYINRFKSTQGMACLYICTSEDMAANKDKLFDRVMYA